MPIIGNPIYQSAFVVDQFSGNGSTTAFTMSVAPAGVTNVLVAVSGVLQDPSTYGVVGNTITFSAAPPSGTGNISCRYLGVPVTGVTTTAYRTVTEFTATASQTTFTPPSYNVGFINVYLNGVLLGSADYTASNGTTVVLATGASAGNLVTVESFQISSVANAIANAAGSVSNSNLATGIVTPAKLSTGGPSWDTSSNLTVAGQASLGTGQADYIAAIGGAGTGRVEIAGSNTNVNLALSTKGTGATYFWRGGYGGTQMALINQYGIGLGATTPSSGMGIAFPAAQSASSDANTLDDYEEGTYTAAFFIISGSTSITYTRQEGKYTKIGNLVYATFTIGWSANSGSGGLVAVNMPFTNICNGPHGGFGTVSYAAGLPVNAVLYGDNNNAWAVLIRQNSANTYYGAGDIASGGGQIMGGFIYHTST